jgi:hypothetical protein
VALALKKHWTAHTDGRHASTDVMAKFNLVDLCQCVKDHERSVHGRLLEMIERDRAFEVASVHKGVGLSILLHDQRQHPAADTARRAREIANNGRG